MLYMGKPTFFGLIDRLSNSRATAQILKHRKWGEWKNEMSEAIIVCTSCNIQRF